MQRLRAAVVGCGRIGSTLEDEAWRDGPTTHAGNYAAHPEVDLVAGVDPDPERRADFERRWGVPAYATLEEMLARERPDIVSVATRADQHKENVVQAAAAGVKAILCEKALATSLQEADAMIEACRRSGTVLLVNHSRRYDPYHRRVKKMIEEGEIGELRAITGFCGGSLMHSGTHLFDAIRFFAGDVVEVYGQLAPGARMDPGGWALLTLASGVRAHVNAAGPAPFFLDLVGTEGLIRIHLDAAMTMELWRRRRESPYFAPFRPVGPLQLATREERRHTLAYGRCVAQVQIDELVRAARTGEPGCCTGEDGRAAMEIAIAVHQSHAARAPVRLPLADRSTVVPNV